MKLLTDFDGVWTDPSGEAAFIREIITGEVSRLTGEGESSIRPRLDQIREDIRRQPTEHGWEESGALSAYADEDPYIENNALCRAIALHHPDLWKPISREYADFGAFGYACYKAGAQRQAEDETALLRSEARQLLENLLAAGWEIVFVSNSSGDKLVSCLGDLADSAGGPIRIRGSACKFVLTGGESPQTRTLAGRTVRIDRDHYRTILEEERPDVVIGDVFSLDLALPLCLREADPDLLRTGVVLMNNDYTPAWSREALGSFTGTAVVDGLEDFTRWLNAQPSHAN